MKIAFIYPPYTHRFFEESLAVVTKEFGTFPPLGLLYAAAIAEKAGHDCIVIDAIAEKLTIDETVKRLEEFKPDMIGYMLTLYHFWTTYHAICVIKERVNVPVMVGNVGMELYPAEIMSHEKIDFGLIGSAQKSLPELIECLAGKKSLHDVSGIAFKEQGKIVINWPETLKEDFSTLPYPARHLIDNSHYHTVMSKVKNMTNMTTCKGCPGSDCNFCFLHPVPYSARTPQDTVGEFKQCYEEFGIREFEIFDPTFTMDRERVLEICRLLEQEAMPIRFNIRTRVDKVDDEVLSALSRAGCSRILYGLESGSQAMLDSICKNITLEQCRSVVLKTRKLGIEALGFFMFGCPGETRQTAMQTIKWAIELKLDYAQFHKMIGKPGSLLYNTVMKELGRDYWRGYLLGTEDECRIPTPWTTLTHQEQEQICQTAYNRFYFRPSYLLKTILGIKSFHEFCRYVRSAWGLIFSASDLNTRSSKLLWAEPNKTVMEQIKQSASSGPDFFGDVVINYVPGSKCRPLYPVPIRIEGGKSVISG